MANNKDTKAKTPKKKAPSHEAPAKPRKKKSSAAATVVIVVIVAALFFGTALAAIHVRDLDTIYPGVSFGGTDLGGMTMTEAADALEAAGYGASSQDITVQLLMGHTLSIPVDEALESDEPMEIAAMLYEYGRDGNLAQNLVSYLRCRVNGYEADAAAMKTVDSDYVKNAVADSVQKANTELMGAALNIGEKEITAVKGFKSVIIDETEVYTLVMNALQSGKYGELSYTPQSTGAEDINLQDIYDTVFKEPKDSEYDPETYSATEHVVGVSFDLDAAKSTWNNAAAGERVVIPLVLTDPEVTQEGLNAKLFADVLAEKSTTLAGSSAARINNVKLACKSINDLILNPGDEFSYNEALGKRTPQAGYQAAGAYSGGEVVSEIGGGICQVSSTLYYCSLYSNLQITDRTCHYFAVAYITPGLDATVSWGGPEFKFVNNREYPIKIESYVENGNCIVRIYGTDVDGSYVQMTTQAWINSDESTGVQSYRNVYAADGTLISSKKESLSKYNIHKEEEEEEEETPEESPEVSPEVSPEIPPAESPEAGIETPVESPEAGTETPVESPEVGAETPVESPEVGAETPVESPAEPEQPDDGAPDDSSEIQ